MSLTALFWLVFAFTLILIFAGVPRSARPWLVLGLLFVLAGTQLIG